VTETKLGDSVARRLMLSQRFFSISAVFGGKNSKEIFGLRGAWGPSEWDGGTSVIAAATPRSRLWKDVRFILGSAKIGQTRPSKQPIDDGKWPNLYENYRLDMRKNQSWDDMIIKYTIYINIMK
jgi:hypothetical protein